jgi:hypothetical protein
MRVPRPSPALVVASLALLLAAGGGAFAAVRSTGSAVNIVDATKAAQVAQVTASGALKVSGSLTATQASASNFVRATVFGLAGSSGCVVVLAPPAGKALIVTGVEVDTFDDPSPGAGQHVSLDVSSCSTQVADVNPPSVGATVLPFQPGLVVPAGSNLSAFVSGALQAEVYAYGYLVSASSVSSVTAQQTGNPGLNR